MKLTHLALAAVAACALAAFQARAQAPATPLNECIWSHAPDDLRAAMIAGAPDPDKVNVPARGKISPELAGAILQACGGPITLQGSHILSYSLSAHAIEIGASRILKASHGATDESLDAAWAKFTPPARIRLAEIFDPSRSKAIPEEEFTAQLTRFMIDLKLGEGDFDVAMAYLCGRAEIVLLPTDPPK